MAKTELERIRAFIKSRGPTAVSRLTGISRRGLQYFMKNHGQSPTYGSLQKLREAMKQ